MVILDVINLPSVLPLALVASGLRLVGHAIRLPQSRGPFPPDTPADLNRFGFNSSKSHTHTREGKEGVN